MKDLRRYPVSEAAAQEMCKELAAMFKTLDQSVIAGRMYALHAGGGLDYKALAQLYSLLALKGAQTLGDDYVIP